MSKRSRKSAQVIVPEVTDEVQQQSGGLMRGSSDDQEMGSKIRNTVPTIERSSYSKLEAIVTHTSDAMIALDEHFHILDLNPAATTALGLSAEKAIGRSCAEVLCCRNLNRMELCGTSSCPLVRVLQQKRPLPNEELIIGDSC